MEEKVKENLWPANTSINLRNLKGSVKVFEYNL